MRNRFIYALILLLIITLLSGCVQNSLADITIDKASTTGGANAKDASNTKYTTTAAVDSDGQNDKASVDELLAQEPAITGYVVDKEGGRILVVDPEPQSFSATGGVVEFYDAIWFSNVTDDISIGQKVSVWCNAIAESYPAQSSAIKTEVVEVQKSESAELSEAEAIAKALAFNETDIDFFLVVKSASYNNEVRQWTIELKDAQGDGTYNVLVDDEENQVINNESNNQPEPFVLDDDLQLGELKVNMTREMIDRVMQSSLQSSEKDTSSGIESEFLYYDDGTVIHLAEGETYSIAVTVPGYATPRGLEVGDSTDDLKRLYGEPAYIDDSGVWVYSPGGYDLFYVTIQDDIVVSIKVSLVM